MFSVTRQQNVRQRFKSEVRNHRVDNYSQSGVGGIYNVTIERKGRLNWRSTSNSASEQSLPRSFIYFTRNFAVLSFLKCTVLMIWDYLIEDMWTLLVPSQLFFIMISISHSSVVPIFPSKSVLSMKTNWWEELITRHPWVIQRFEQEGGSSSDLFLLLWFPLRTPALKYKLPLQSESVVMHSISKQVEARYP